MLWYLIEVLVCIPLMTNAHLFRCLLAIFRPPLVNCLDPLPTFYWVICFLLNYKMIFQRQGMKLFKILSVVGGFPSLPFSLGSGQDNRVGGGGFG